MNLSQWQDYSTDDRLRLLSEIGSAVRNGEMPVQRYVRFVPKPVSAIWSGNRFTTGLEPSEAVYGYTNRKQTRFASPRTHSSGRYFCPNAGLVVTRCWMSWLFSVQEYSIISGNSAVN
jgi:hypothetical protein